MSDGGAQDNKSSSKEELQEQQKYQWEQDEDIKEEHRRMDEQFKDLRNRERRKDARAVDQLDVYAI